MSKIRRDLGRLAVDMKFPIHRQEVEQIRANVFYSTFFFIFVTFLRFSLISGTFCG